MSSTALAERDSTIAVLLELLFGFVFQTFGVGHIYQGRVGMGLFIMLSYWALQAVNALLMVVLVGFVTAPLTFLFYMIAAPLNAAGEGRRS
jgi:TM2 domain-containing membrane protein YozV